MLIDEYDAQAAGDKEMAESLRGQLNSSFNRRSAVVLKSVPLPGGGWDTRQFSTWAPTCVAGIGKQSETVEDRGVIIRLERKPRDVKVSRLRGKDGGELAVLARKLARFVVDNEHAIRNAEPEVPDALNDRQQDAWTPLFTVADVAGGAWPDRARAAAKALCQIAAEEDVEADIKTVLLADIRDIFVRLFPDHGQERDDGPGRPGDGPRLLTKQLLDELHALEERPWIAWGKSRKPLTDLGLASFLRPYGVHSSTVRVEDASGQIVRGKGYFLRSLEDVFSRYLPPSGVSTPVPPCQTRQTLGENELSEPVPSSVWHGAENAGNPSNSRIWHGGTGSKGEKGSGEKNEAPDDAREDASSEWDFDL